MDTSEANPSWDAAAHAMYRAAQAVSHFGGPGFPAFVVRELAEILGAAAVFIAVLRDEGRTLSTIAAILDGRPLPAFHYPVAGSPCEYVVGQSFRYMPAGLRAERKFATFFGADDLDAYAACPLNDRNSVPIGLLVTMHREPFADVALAESLLRIFAGRVVAEIERDRADEAIRRSEARLRATVEAALDCVIGIDDQGRIVEFNAAAERCFGYRRADVLGRAAADTIVPERLRRAADRWLARAHTAEEESAGGELIEAVARRADGSEFPVEVAVCVGRLPEGRILVGYIRDITTRRASEAERTALEAQLRQAQKMEAIGQLTGGIAHDFNNMLTSISGFVVLAEERAQAVGEKTIVRQLGRAQEAARRARDLTAQMLAFSRRKPGSREPVDLAAVVEQAAQLLRVTLPSSLDLDVEDIERERYVVLGDAGQLEQVLFNLCLNARDALNERGRIAVRIRPVRGPWRCASCGAADDETERIELRVQDNGTGIEPAVLARMFEPFFSTKATGRGSGMGLAMVHGIVHDHRGHIAVDTEPGRGSAFRLLLPAAEKNVALASAAPVAAPVSREPLMRGHVMLVEDDALVGDFLHELMTGWGLDVALYHDPLEAERQLARDVVQIDLLLTDYTMPGISGLDLIERARRHRPRLPAVLMTGNTASFDPEAVADAGTCAVIRKPLTPPQLRAVLTRCFERNAARS